MKILCRITCTIFGLLIALPVYAWSWQNVWQTPDQQGQKLMNQGQYIEAAKRFQRPDWRATAAFQAKDYQHAAQDFLQSHTIEGSYNAGNALAMQGQYQQAIAAYDNMLAQSPNHQDAQYNRRLVQALLDKQKSQSSPDQKKSDPQQDQQQPSKGSSQNNKDQPESQPSTDPKSQQPTKSPSSKQKDEPSSAQPKSKPAHQPPAQKKHPLTRAQREQKKADEQWLQLIPDDPGGLLREKFLRDHLKRKNGWSS